LIGQDRALELMMVGKVVPAARALELGMVHKVFPADELMDAAMAFANRLANMPGDTAGTIKRVVTEGAGKPMDEALLVEQDGFWELMESGEALERMKAYVEGGQNPGVR
jgi:enoyl-CoA hydratase/carnithine racemase